MLYYDADSVAPTDYVSFARKPQGWSILLTDEQDILVKEELFWNSSKGAFEQISFPVLSEAKLSDSSVSINSSMRLLAKRDSTMFFHNLYYGYIGWENDVIKKLEPRLDSMNIKELHCLARAWSSLGRSILSPNTTQRGMKYLEFDSTFNKESISSVLIDSFTRTRENSISCYKKILERDSTFVGIVGDIKTILSGEYLSAFVELRTLGQFTEAKKYIVDDLFDPFLISVGKNLMKECGQNGIIFTTGDIDTYILLYLQEKYKYRTDVSVVNTSLMNTGRYINYLCRFEEESKRLKTSLPMKSYTAWKNEYLFTGPYQESPANLKDAIRAIENDTTQTIPRDLYLKLDTVGLSGYDKYYPQGLDRDSMSWRIQGYYIWKAELFFLDYLSSNGFKRPIYFTLHDDYFNLDEHLISVGFLSELTPSPRHAIPSDYYKLLTEQFERVPASTIPAWKLKGIWFNHIRYAFYGLAQEYQDINKATSLMLLDTGLTLYVPPGGSYSDIGYSYMYYTLDEKEKGINLLDKMYTMAKKRLDELFLVKDQAHVKEIIETIADLKVIQRYAESYDDKSLKKKVNSGIEDVKEKYESY